ncbi:MAG: prepilin-type N-terminal cleavage/methylation domain-containing protein [Patescibacteria group bacterium]
MFKLKREKGFTLIELLIVIAIIAILATIVVIALNDARNKGADGSVKSNLSSARSVAEVFYNTNVANPNTYILLCTNGTIGGISGNMLAAIKSAGLVSYTTNGTGTLTTATCNENGSSWAAEVPLKSPSNSMWCVDSLAASRKTTSSIGAGTVCPLN